MIHLFTDFGHAGPYLGQMRAVLRRAAPEIPVVDLMADAPAFDSRRSAYLLAALAPWLEPGEVLLGIVDPGVGGEREALALRLDGVWHIGPDNGLFEPALRRAGTSACFRIAWRPSALSASFHGRDLFAPMAARLARGERAGLAACAPRRFPQWPDDLAEIVHVDRYGNAVTGWRAAMLPEDTLLEVAGRRLGFARTFTAVPVGAVFWYANSVGLVEIAAHGASAAQLLGLTVGSPIRQLV
jgi:S-adenosylmethionine hydrolase